MSCQGIIVCTLWVLQVTVGQVKKHDFYVAHPCVIDDEGARETFNVRPECLAGT